MPTNHCFRRDQEKRTFPARPKPPHQDPEQPVVGRELWVFALGLQDGKLLAQREVFQHEMSLRATQTKQGTKNKPQEAEHESDFRELMEEDDEALKSLIIILIAILASHTMENNSVIR